jgi:hypothetical protein
MTELSMGAISVMCFKVMVFFKNLSKKKKGFFFPPKITCEQMTKYFHLIFFVTMMPQESVEQDT